jgi:hypothetical protein
MIRALSPFYIDTPLVYSGYTCAKYTLNVWVWNGDKSTPDSTNSYQITYQNTTASTGSHSININAIIQDYIEFKEPSLFLSTGIQLIGGKNQQWVYTYVTYDDLTALEHEETEIMTLGYTYGNEGRNVTAVTNQTLINPQEYKVNREGNFVFPIYVPVALGTSDIITVKSYPSLDINYSATATQSDESSEIVQYLWVDLSLAVDDSYIEIVWKGKTTTLDLTDECKYTPLDVFFQNKDGALQTFTFFKKQEETIDVTDSSFETNRGQASDGFHQFVRYGVQGRTTLTAETGWLDEDMNEVLKQILLTERIWSYDGTKYTPLNIKKTSQKFKTRQNDRLINYTMTFEMSYNEINNI